MSAKIADSKINVQNNRFKIYMSQTFKLEDYYWLKKKFKK